MIFTFRQLVKCRAQYPVLLTANVIYFFKALKTSAIPLSIVAIAGSTVINMLQTIGSIFRCAISLGVANAYA